MVYKVIGLMSGSSLDGLDIVYVHLQEGVSTLKDTPRKWEFSILHAVCYPYPEQWKQKLAGARSLSAGDYLMLHTDYGRWLGEQVLRFIDENNLHYQVQLIASHGHTTFHSPENKMTAQLGDGAALAAITKINVVSDLRAMDVALGGQGAPIVPVGERLLLPEYGFFLNLGGIANISAHGSRLSAAGGGVDVGSGTGAAASVAGVGSAGVRGGFVAFDVCPANRVLNELAALTGKEYDAGGTLAAGGVVDEGLLHRLNELSYYAKTYPKSLANEFGTETVLPMIQDAALRVEDALRTYVEHIAVQVRRAVEGLMPSDGARMLVTGGGAHNEFLIGRLRELLTPLGVEVVVPDDQLVDYKEALVMALIGVLRWREENNVFASVTGASRDSIGGAVWIGQEA